MKPVLIPTMTTATRKHLESYRTANKPSKPSTPNGKTNRPKHTVRVSTLRRPKHHSRKTQSSNQKLNLISLSTDSNHSKKQQRFKSWEINYLWRRKWCGVCFRGIKSLKSKTVRVMIWHRLMVGTNRITINSLNSNSVKKMIKLNSLKSSWKSVGK